MKTLGLVGVLALLLGCPAPVPAPPDAGAPDAAVEPPVDAGPPDAGPADAGSPAQQFCTQLAAAYCGLRQRCGALRLLERSACEAQTRASCEVDARLVEVDRAVLPAAAATACLARLAATNDCDAYCAPFELGAPLGLTCTSGALCRGSTCDNATACGRCAPFAAVGQPCGASPCDPAVAVCLGGTCVALAPVGAPCQVVNGQVDCADDVYCLDTDAGARCTILGDGAPCFFDETCRSNSRCRAGPGGPPGVCTRLLAIGADCTAQLDGCARSNSSQAGCLDGVCRRLDAADRALDQQCFRTADCVQGLTCRTTSSGESRCQAPLDAGAPCDSLFAACAPGDTCVCAAVPCSCQPLGGPGAPCDPNTGARCFDTLFCRQGVCTPQLAVGAPCTSLFDCAPPARCLGTQCSLGQAADAPCQLSLECASGVCSRAGRCVDACY